MTIVLSNDRRRRIFCKKKYLKVPKSQLTSSIINQINAKGDNSKNLKKELPSNKY